jgi:hypothetical protein
MTFRRQVPGNTTLLTRVARSMRTRLAARQEQASPRRRRAMRQTATALILAGLVTVGGAGAALAQHEGFVPNHWKPTLYCGWDTYGNPLVQVFGPAYVDPWPGTENINFGTGGFTPDTGLYWTAGVQWFEGGRWHSYSSPWQYNRDGRGRNGGQMWQLYGPNGPYIDGNWNRREPNTNDLGIQGAWAIPLKRGFEFHLYSYLYWSSGPTMHTDYVGTCRY